MRQFLSLLVLVLTFSISAKVSAQGPEIKFDNTEHNYGTIAENGGKAKHVFWFTNIGTDTLVLSSVRPGCGCTASDYTKTGIATGQKGFVTAEYNPVGRPGPFKKSISITSNAKNTPHVTLFISGNVTPKPKDHTDTFRIHLGDLLVDRNNPVFHNIRWDAIITDTVKIYNNSQTDMTLSLKESPAHIKVAFSTNKLKPKSRGYITLRYDAAKAGTSGNRNDRVYISTNDPKQLDKLLFITATIQQAPAKPNPEQLYPYQMGNIRMSRNSVVFPNILNTETKSDSVVLYNAGNYPIQIDIKRVTPEITANLSKNVIKPEETMMINVTYNATKATGFGFVSGSRIELASNDSLQGTKLIYVSANIKEDFSKLSAKQRDNAPKIEFKEKTFDFGTAISGKAVPYSFEFTNVGKSELIIRRVNASCGCTATNPAKTTLQPGESSKIDINFNTSGRVGQQHKSITVITNDPNTPEVILLVKGVLKKEGE